MVDDRLSSATPSPLDRRTARAVAARRVLRAGTEALDEVAVEEPLEIRIDGEPVATTMRTPGADADLALGFLFAEGLLERADDVSAVVHCGRPGDEGYGNVLDVRSGAGARLDPERVLDLRRFVPVASACGVCGRRSIEGLLLRIRPLDESTRLPPSLAVNAIAALASVQPGFARTGGLHAVAAFGADGALLAAAEDVGRHNAVDKVVGALFRAGRMLRGAQHERSPGPGAPALLAVSGRAGFEIVQKAAAARIPAVASVSAPTSLAVDLAVAARIALLGFVRGGRFNVYANAWRLEGTADPRGSGGNPDPSAGASI
jgi:FdhD protein